MPGATVLTVSSRAAAGLTRAEVTDPDGRIAVDAMQALWREAHVRANDPDLALHAAQAHRSARTP